jgi:hypothetical protein
MRRIGPLVFSGGILLVCAGIASTSLESWKKPQRDESTIVLDTLDMQGVEALEIGGQQHATVRITDRQPRVIIRWWDNSARAETAEPVVATRSGNRLQLQFTPKYLARGSMTVEIAPGLALISATRLSVKAESNAGALRVDASHLDWQGDADALDIRALAEPAPTDNTCATRPDVTFANGRVERLRISIEWGEVHLGDLSAVDHIELHAGPDVSLSVAHLHDLQRIEMHPFDREATAPPRTQGRSECPEDVLDVAM